MDKLVEFLSNLDVKPPCTNVTPTHKRKAPLFRTFWRRFCSGQKYVVSEKLPSSFFLLTCRHTLFRFIKTMLITSSVDIKARPTTPYLSQDKIQLVNFGNMHDYNSCFFLHANNGFNCFTLHPLNLLCNLKERCGCATNTISGMCVIKRFFHSRFHCASEGSSWNLLQA